MDTRNSYKNAYQVICQELKVLPNNHEKIAQSKVVMASAIGL